MKQNLDILDIILDLLNEVNFREFAKIQTNGSIALKHYRVCGVRELFKRAKEEGYQFMVDNGCPNVYNGEYWEVVGKEKMKNFLSKASVKMGVNEVDSECFKFVEDLFKQAMTSADVRKDVEKREVCINLQNGTFAISEDGQGLREFRADDYLKYRLNFKFSRSSKCPTFIGFLNEVLPDEDAQRGLAEFIASVFVPWLKIEKTVLLYGSGANGKSVIFDIICALIGKDNISTYSLENLTNNAGYQRAEIGDKLLNYTSEISGNLNSAIFKQLASGEAVEARRIFGTPFIMENYAKLMFNCNVLPRNVELTDAYFRRFYIIPFEYTVPVEKRDPNLAKKIIDTELAGVFNWVLEGLERLLKQKHLTESRIVQDMIERYKIESNSIALFMEDEGYSISIAKKIYLDDIYPKYVTYCRDSGYKALSMIRFSKGLSSLGIEKDRDSRKTFFYIEKAS